MEQRTNAEILKTFKRANKDAKLRMAVKAGYDTADKYKNFLEGNIPAEPTKAVKNNKGYKPTIHVVDILDASGSMSGEKMKNAQKGINSSLEDLKGITNVNYTYTLCHFSYYTDIIISHDKVKLSSVKEINVKTRGNTALYDAIGLTLRTVQKNLAKSDKVLVNIYTDGCENDSREFSKGRISAMIEELQAKNFTITFIGTENDTREVIKDLKIDKSNTLTYDGTAKGLEKSMVLNSNARVAYSASVVSGEDVSKGFYKNLNSEQ